MTARAFDNRCPVHISGPCLLSNDITGSSRAINDDDTRWVRGEVGSLLASWPAITWTVSLTMAYTPYTCLFSDRTKKNWRLFHSMDRLSWERRIWVIQLYMKSDLNKFTRRFIKNVCRFLRYGRLQRCCCGKK